jgi:probable HAF family extracellular repeat protein
MKPCYSFALAALLAIACGPAGALNATYTYTFIDMPNSNPACLWTPGFNDLGQIIIGDCPPGNNSVNISYLWTPGANGQPGTLTPIQYPNAGTAGTLAEGISNAGEIVGTWWDQNGAEHGFTYVNGVWTSFDHPPVSGGGPVATEFSGIAPRAGESVGIPGDFTSPATGLVATIYNAGRSVIDPNPADLWQDLNGDTDPVNGALNSILGYPATPAQTYSRGINDSGVFVGRRAAPFWDGWVYQGGAIPTCPLLTLANPTPPPGCTPRYYTFTVPGTTPGVGITAARGISPAGDVVGWFSPDTSDSMNDGYVRWHDGTYQILNVVDPATGFSYAGLTAAYSINSLGSIAGTVFSPAQWAGQAIGGRIFIAVPQSSSTPAPAATCAASSGGCDLSNGAIPHAVIGGPSPLPGTVSESTCTVIPDPRIAQYGSCTGHPLPVASVCPGFGTTVIPDTLCGGAGPANNGFMLVRTVAEGVDALSGILVDSEAFADTALGGTAPACPQTVGAWAPRSDSAVEGTVPEGTNIVELTGGCGSSKGVSRGLSIYGVGLTLNTAALPGGSLPEKLRIFTAEKYANLYRTIAAGNVTLAERIRVNACVAISEGFFIFNKAACAARTIVQCDAQVGANVGDFGSSPSDPNVYGDIRGRLANLYLTINTRLLGNPPNTNWPVPLSSAPACRE